MDTLQQNNVWRGPRRFLLPPFLPLLAIMAAAMLAGAVLLTGAAPALCAPPPPAVSYITVAREDVGFTKTFVGHVEGERFVQVRAQVSGLLKSRLYEEGALVQKGQPLFQIDPGQYKAAYEQAQGRLEAMRARFTNAARDYERAVPLARGNAISPREFDKVQAEHNAAKASLDEAAAALSAAAMRLELATVVAPVTGYATMANLEEGSLVAASSPADSLLTTINSMENVNVIFAVPDSLVRRIEGYIRNNGAEIYRNAEAELEIDQNLPYPHKGRITYGNAVVSRQTGSMLARALFPNPEYRLLSGQVVRISVKLLTFHNAVLLPQHAVLQGQGGSLAVVLKDDDTVEFRPVSVLAGIKPNYFVVVSGLESGERVVVEGTGKVGPGSKVVPTALDRPKAASESLPEAPSKNTPEASSVNAPEALGKNTPEAMPETSK